MNTPTPSKLFSSLLVQLLLVLLACVLYNVILVHSYSADAAWDDHHPWFGDVEEVIRHDDTGGVDVYLLRPSQQQIAEWEQTFGLKRSFDPSRDFYRARTAQDIQLEGNRHPKRRYKILLQQPNRGLDSEYPRGVYELKISEVNPHNPYEESSAETLTIAKRYLEPRSIMEGIVVMGVFLLWLMVPALMARLFIWRLAQRYPDADSLTESIVGTTSLMRFLLFPALLARFLLRGEERLFSYKEFLLNYLAACVLYLLFKSTAVWSIDTFASSSVDKPYFMLIGVVIACPFFNGIACLILYLVILPYRWWRRKAQRASQPSVSASSGG